MTTLFSFISSIFTYLRFVTQLRNIKRQIFVGVLVFTSSVIWAQGPNGTGTYYQRTDGLKGAALNALQIAEYIIENNLI